MADSVRILHCADLHLGAEVIKLKGRTKARRQEFRRTFHKILEIAEKEEVSLLIVAGDLFDVPAAPWDLCEEVRDAFAEAPFTIALCSGNHDPATADSVYLRENFWSENVIIFSSSIKTVELPEIGVRLVGAGFTGAYSSHTQLRRMVLPEDELLNIGIMHGTIAPEGQGSDYNPITVRQIENSGLDYLALGHIHTRKEPEKAGKTTYAYSGCTEGRKFGENGEKGVYIADVSHYGCDVRFVPVCERRLETVTVDVTDLENVNAVAFEVRKALENVCGKDYREQIFRVTLEGEQGKGLPQGTGQLENLLSDIWYIEITDAMIPFVDEAETESANTLKGLFLSNLEKMSGEVPPKRLEMAKKLGLRAFIGNIDVE